jgi:hypothetical protein
MTTDTPDTRAADEPQLHDVVAVHPCIDPYEDRLGVITDIYRVPGMTDGVRYRVEFRGGNSSWYWPDRITVREWDTARYAVITALGTARAVLFDALTTAEQHHDVLYTHLSGIFHALTEAAANDLGVTLDPPPAPIYDLGTDHEAAS